MLLLYRLKRKNIFQLTLERTDFKLTYTTNYDKIFIERKYYLIDLIIPIHYFPSKQQKLNN